MDGNVERIFRAEMPAIGSVGPCLACRSPYTVWMQKVRGQRTNKFYDQWICLDCRTAFNPTGYVEDDDQLKADAGFLRAEIEATTRLQSQLCLEILTLAPCVRTACEIGSGTGRMLQALKDYGVEAEGYELNPYAAEIALEYGLKTIQEPLPEGDRRYDLMLAIGVLEHVPSAYDLFGLMTRRLTPDGAIYISVPFFEREHWRCLETASENNVPPNIFYDNDVHQIHFSIEGLKAMGRRWGARSAEYFTSKDVVFNAPTAYPGVLFRF